MRRCRLTAGARAAPAPAAAGCPAAAAGTAAAATAAAQVTATTSGRGWSVGLGDGIEAWKVLVHLQQVAQLDVRLVLHILQRLGRRAAAAQRRPEGETQLGQVAALQAINKQYQ